MRAILHTVHSGLIALVMFVLALGVGGFAAVALGAGLMGLMGVSGAAFIPGPVAAGVFAVLASLVLGAALWAGIGSFRMMMRPREIA